MNEIATLFHKLDHPEESTATRQRIIEQGPSIVAPLLDLFEQGNPLQQANAILVLGELGDSQAIPVLIDCLSHESLLCRINAAQMLGHFSDACVTTALLANLPTARELVQIWIINSLGLIGDRSSVDPLVELLHQTRSSSVRYMIIRALGLIKDPRIAKDIVPYLQDDDHHVRHDATVALHNLGYFK